MDQIQKQLAALKTDQFRITLKPRFNGFGLYDRNFGNQYNSKIRKEKGIAEYFHSTADVLLSLPKLRSENFKGFDIYITPISADFHHLVVDDLTLETLKSLLDDGYSPTLIQYSSYNNYQAVLLAEKQPGRYEQSFANFVVSQINKKYGDKKFSGVIHPFRLATFCNKKQGKDNAVTQVVTVTDKICAKSSIEIAQERNSTPYCCPPNDNLLAATVYNCNDGVADKDQSACDFFLTQWNAEKRIVKTKNWAVDDSRLDLQVAKIMKQLGYSSEIVFSAMVYSSPQIQTRHRDTVKYAKDTVNMAFSMVSTMKHAEEIKTMLIRDF
jgi:hypothetical protein